MLFGQAQLAGLVYRRREAAVTLSNAQHSSGAEPPITNLDLVQIHKDPPKELEALRKEKLNHGA
jgi:hypothetical protein